jgi:hypothetical protein
VQNSAEVIGNQIFNRSRIVLSIGSVSLVYWSCKFVRNCACSHSVKCLPTAFVESLVACCIDPQVSTRMNIKQHIG